MEIHCIDTEFSVCKVRDYAGIDLEGEFLFLGKTDREHSLVCPTDCAPSDALAREDGWRALRIEGSLDFSLVGVLARISAILAARGIAIFAVSTFDTDYILVKSDAFARAVEALSEAGYASA